MNTRVLVLGWMAAILIAGSVLATEPTSDPKSAGQEPAQPRSLTAIQRDVHAALRAEALSRRQGPNVSEVVRLIELYREMAEHPKRNQSEMLAELGLKVRGRLADVCEQIERKIATAKKDATKAAKKTKEV